MRFALLEAKLGIVKAMRLVEIQKCEKTEVSDDTFHIIILSSVSSLGSASVRKSNSFEQQK
jgi:hypothetical protein